MFFLLRSEIEANTVNWVLSHSFLNFSLYILLHCSQVSSLTFFQIWEPSCINQICLIILITKHHFFIFDMKKANTGEECPEEQVEEELTVQDINLRQTITNNSSSTHQHIDFAPILADSFQSSQLKKQSYLTSSHYQDVQNGKSQKGGCQNGSIGNTTLLRDGQIHSLAYLHRSQALQRKQGSRKKQKLCLSLSTKLPYHQNIFSKQSQEKCHQFEDSKPLKEPERLSGVIKVELQKENISSPPLKQIIQPVLHSRHPVSQKHNGGHLSKIIMQRARQHGKLRI